jgi:predicted transcriptional regulator
MGRNDSGKVTDAEMEVLNILWHRGPSTVRDVHTVLTSLREIQYTTTLKALQVMTGKGLVKRDEASKAHVYEAAVDREQTQRKLVGDLVNRVFSGSAVGLMAGALSAKKASPEELAELRQLLDQAEKEST